MKQSPRQHSRLSLILLVRQSRICRRIRRRGGAGDDPPHDYEDNRENYAARQPVLYAMPLASLAQSVPMNDGGRNAPPFPDKRGDVVTIDHFLCFANAEGTLMRLDGTENYTEDDARSKLELHLEKGKTDSRYRQPAIFPTRITTGERS